MIPVKKPWTNEVIGKGQKHVLPCPSHINDRTGEVTVAMELTDEEVKAIIKHKTILYKVDTYHNPMQPFHLWVEDEKGKPINDERIDKIEKEVENG